MKTTISQQRERQRHGEIGQAQAAKLLRDLGATCVQQISTPWRIVRIKGRVVGAHPIGEVTGDFTGLLPGGRGLLVEVKRREDGVLSWGDFEDHQHASLRAHADAGGAAWVIMATPATIMAMWYTSMVSTGWRTGKPLHVEDCQRLTIGAPSEPPFRLS